MSSRSSGRRRLRSVLSAGLVLALTGAFALDEAYGASAQSAKPSQKKTKSAVHTRKEIHHLTATEIANYRKGVALMQSRAFTDPTSWIYQANMHGYPTSNTICPVVGTPQPQWSTCQHGSFFFLAWHRMYLYYFERILQAAVREAIKDPAYTFSLPFWNYEDPAHRDLPEPFRVPADTATNPLYVAQRASNCNSGQQCVSASDASDSVAMGLTPFCSCSGGSCTGCTTGISSDESFGGGFIPAPNHSASVPGELEIQPHGQVHNAVGGPKGWMSFFTCAARDPIFWLHHANIDRLWQVWLNKGGRANPIANNEWATQTFTFFDENKQAVTLTGCQIVNMATQLDYKYEGVAVNNVKLCTATTAEVAPTAAAVPAPKVLAATAPAENRLGNAPVSVKVALPAEAGAHMRSIAAAPAKPGRLRLAIEGIKILNPGAVYQVYLNLPAGQKPDPAGPYYLGNISLFAEPEHSEEVTRTFDLSPRMKALAGKGELQVTIVREQLGAAAAGEPQEFLRFSRVSILER
jgi:Common central domain of tyrosinase/Polyphenol oxidase middle domain